MADAISVVIPNARGFPATLVKRLLEQMGDDDELYLIEDDTWTSDRWNLGSAGDTTSSPHDSDSDVCLEFFDDDRFDKRETTGNGGGAEARNIGWRAATNDVVLFLNDDLYVPDGFIADVRASIDAHPSADILCYRVSRFQDPNPWIMLSKRTVSLDRGGAFKTTRGAPLSIDEVRDYGTGAALLADRTILEETGGYKDELGPGRPHGGTDDIEILWHVSLHGGTISYIGDLEVQHPVPESFEEWERKLEDYASAVGHLAGAVGTEAAADWARSYKDILRKTSQNEVESILPRTYHREARRVINDAIQTIDYRYKQASRRDLDTIYLCSDCRRSALTKKGP